MTTEQQNADAILAALNAALAPKMAYEVDDVPSPRPAEYVEVQLVRRFGGTARGCGWKGTVGYRLTVFGISQTSASNARMLLEKCRAALEFQHLVVDGQQTTPIQFETANEVAPDDGWLSGFHDYTYAL